jgi:hypothetical protein
MGYYTVLNKNLNTLTNILNYLHINVQSVSDMCCITSKSTCRP